MLIAACCSYFFEGLVVLNKQPVSQLHSLLLYKGKNIAAILLEESASEGRDAHTGFGGEAFSRYFLMEIIYDKYLYLRQVGSMVKKLCQLDDFKDQKC